MSKAGIKVGITLGDPRGIGPEVSATALSSMSEHDRASFVVLGWEGSLPEEALSRSSVTFEPIGSWPPDRGGSDDEAAGELCARAIERGVGLALRGDLDGLVTGPVSKKALGAAGYPFPGHTEFFRDRSGVPEVCMMMAAETTPLGGPLRMALLTSHIPLRDVPSALNQELVETRSRLAVRALREWWGLASPTLAFAGVNPHASEDGRFGDEEERVLVPAIQRLREDGIRVQGIFPSDTVFGRCISGDVDAVIVPYHDVGLAVLKTIARDAGVNVTAGLPFPRTSPDHGTAFDIAGTGVADPGSTRAAIALCVQFCERAVSTSGTRDLGRDGGGTQRSGVAG
jgi:4-hydroxythreonine-4-phosphate dehydrogenase